MRFAVAKRAPFRHADFMGLWDRLLDKTVYFSFDSSGFLRHAEDFRQADLDVDLTGKRFVVTGANAGLGFATAKALASLGGHVYLFCRNPERARQAQQRIASDAPGASTRIVLVDMGDLQAVDAAAEALGDLPLAGLIHNAGLMPDSYRTTPQGFELSYAVHLLGPLRLTWRLLPNLRAGGGRVVFVTSGGMYTESLDLRTLANSESSFKKGYKGITAYARTKRGQAELASLLAGRIKLPIRVHAMHPGWADTGGVKVSMPRFYKFVGDRLRTPEQGADTIVWLAASTTNPPSDFWFDREPASMFLIKKYRTHPAHRAGLLPQLCADADVPLSAFGS
ncbi:MAG: dehydrogenase/reductase SDR family protein 12 [Bradymonadia bacterium]|jgi:dehydrogenase/reductase SDR family protein 12